MLDHNRTPRLTRHARVRCKEMGISTKVAKAIYRHPAVCRVTNDRPATDDLYLVTSDLHPVYAIVVTDGPSGPTVVTVVFRTAQTYVRDGSTYRIEKRQGGV